LFRLTLLAALVFATGLHIAERPTLGQADAADQPAVVEGPVAEEKASEPESKMPEPEVPEGQRSPRETMRTFLVAMDSRDWAIVVATLDFSGMDPEPNVLVKIEYAYRLKVVIERLAIVDFERISDSPEASTFNFPEEAEDPPIQIIRNEDGAWRFSPATVSRIDALYEEYREKPRAFDLVAKDEPAEVEEETPPGAMDSEAEPAAPLDVPDELQSARKTMRFFLTTLDEADAKKRGEAIAALDFSAMETSPGPFVSLDYARRLKAVIDRMAIVDYGQIEDDPEGPTFRFPPDAVYQPIEIDRGEDGAWRFSTDTVSRIDSLYEEYKDKPILATERPWYREELVLGNEVWRVLSLAACILLGLVVGQSLRLAFAFMATRADRRDRPVLTVAFKTLSKSAIPILVLLALRGGLQLLVLDHAVESFATAMVQVLGALVVGYVMFRLVDVVVELIKKVAIRSGSTLHDMLVPVVSTSLRLTVVVLVLLEIATALSDQPPSSVIAGLGASGLAIGLAAQDTIKSLFGSIMIFADRPFELGDRIVVDGHDGPVESVGFRSTRIRTLDGHLVTITNGDMAYKTILNIGKRPYIRRVMNIRIPYDTRPDMVQRSLDIVREVLHDHEGMKEEFPPRVFLQDFLDEAVNIRAIYWYHPPSYWDFCDFSERVNMQIIKRFEAEGIQFALPAQTLYLANGSGKPLDRGQT
jgi:MscS family membrane protein